MESFTISLFIFIINMFLYRAHTIVVLECAQISVCQLSGSRVTTVFQSSLFLMNGVDNIRFIFAPLNVFILSRFSGRFAYVCRNGVDHTIFRPASRKVVPSVFSYSSRCRMRAY
jgi:hypothetical protein